MNQLPTHTDFDLWQNLLATDTAYRVAFRAFLAEGVDRVAVLRGALRGRDREVALTVAPYLKASERIELFPEWVFLASFAHGAIQVPRDMIVSLPREWVLTRIEQEAEPLLHEGTYDEYRRLLELYVLLDHEVALRLARRAAAHADPDIREAGEDFLSNLLPAQMQAEFR